MQENTFENIVDKVMAILSRIHVVNILRREQNCIPSLW